MIQPIAMVYFQKARHYGIYTSFIQSFDKHLFSVHSMPGTLLETGCLWKKKRKARKGRHGYESGKKEYDKGKPNFKWRFYIFNWRFKNIESLGERNWMWGRGSRVEGNQRSKLKGDMEREAWKRTSNLIRKITHLWNYFKNIENDQYFNRKSKKYIIQS